MDPVSLVLRLLHILPAVFLAGGILFMWSALLPGLSGLDEETRKSVFGAVRGKWAKVVMTCSALLLATGLYNAVLNIIKYDYETPYHIFVTLKLVLAIAIMFITARLSGRSESAEKFREKMPFWMTVNTALVFVLIFIASSMKVSEKTLKPEDIDVPVDVELNIEQE